MADLYLNSTATTKPTDLAINSFVNINTNNWYNPSATMSEGGIEARRIVERSRESIAYGINAKPEQIIFTSGSTEGANMIIKGFVPRRRESDFGIICSPIEHPAVWETCMYMKNHGVDVKVVDVDHQGYIDEDSLKNALINLQFKDGVLVCICDGNNEIGTVQNTKRLADIVHEFPRAHLFADMTQSFAHARRFKVDELDYDFACGAAHKFGGLKGVGFVYARFPELLTPLLHGGGQENGMRSGTENVGGIYSMALQFAEVCNARDHGDLDYIQKLNRRLRHLLSVSNIYHEVLSPIDGLDGIVSICMPGHDANQIVTMLELQNIQVSAGSACHTGENKPSRVLKAIGLTDDEARSTIRISLSSEVSRMDIDRFVDVLKGVM